MLDEVAYWAIFHETGKPALTIRIEVDFKRAVVLPAEIEVRAMVTERRRRRITVEARLMVHGKVHALARNRIPPHGSGEMASHRRCRRLFTGLDCLFSAGTFRLERATNGRDGDPIDSRPEAQQSFFVQRWTYDDRLRAWGGSASECPYERQMAPHSSTPAGIRGQTPKIRPPPARGMHSP